VLAVKRLSLRETVPRDAIEYNENVFRTPDGSLKTAV
jgi:hypothetical protein